MKTFVPLFENYNVQQTKEIDWDTECICDECGEISSPAQSGSERDPVKSADGLALVTYDCPNCMNPIAMDNTVPPPVELENDFA